MQTNQVVQGIGSFTSLPKKPQASGETTATPEVLPAVKKPRFDINLSAAEADTVRLAYDQPDGRHQKAISTYQSIASEPSRQQIDKVFGIDLFA